MPIYKEKNRYIVKVSINGKQVLRRKYLGRDMLTKSSAILCEKDLITQYSDRQANYNIDELFNLYEEYLYKKYKETSAKRYLSSFNLVVKKYFVGLCIKDITINYCELINDKIYNLPYKNIKIYLFLVKSFISFLRNYNLKINSNVFYAYKKSRTNKIEHDYYTLDEFNTFISVINDPKYILLFKLLFFYGLRCGELRGLKVKDFKDDRIVIERELSNKGRFGGQKVFDTKTISSVRDYPYVSDIKELYLNFIKANNLHKNDFVFQTKSNGTVLGETTIRRKCLEFSSKANLRPIKIHEFRHSCASYLINKNVDPKDIANRLGHSSVDTTLRVYAHLLPIRKQQIKKIIDLGN